MYGGNTPFPPPAPLELPSWTLKNVSEVCVCVCVGVVFVCMHVRVCVCVHMCMCGKRIESSAGFSSGDFLLPSPVLSLFHVLLNLCFLLYFLPPSLRSKILKHVYEAVHDRELFEIASAVISIQKLVIVKYVEF